MYLSNMHICYVELPLGVSIFNREKPFASKIKSNLHCFFNPYQGVKSETNIPQLLQGRMPFLEMW